MSQVARRDFLKAAPAAAALASYASAAAGQRERRPPPRDVPIGSVPYTPIADYPIQPKRHWEVTLDDAFWKPRVATNAEVTIPFQVRKIVDSDRGLTGNVLEAAILSLKTHPDPVLQAQVDAAVQKALQGPATSNRGFEVAATRYQVTGERDLLEHAARTAAALYDDFTRRNPPFSGGERDAMNCVQLYRSTQDKRHLDLAKHYLDIRGRADSVNRSRHNQSHKHVLEQRDAVGHAVNGVTLMVSMADVGILTGLREYYQASHDMWADIVARKMYVTGGVGTTGNEGFGEPYSLPNINAYSETCAVLMFITLNQRLFMATGEARYIDVLERGMYNNAVCGVSTSGNRFFYVNRLASAGDGRDARWAHASLECCPPNLVRFLASMPSLIYAQDTRTGAVHVNLYVSSSTRFDVAGRALGLVLQSEMPWGGDSRITVAAKEPTRAAIKLRIPGWTVDRPAPGGLYRYLDAQATAPLVSVNGRRLGQGPDRSGYVAIERSWSDGDTIEVKFPMHPRFVVADERVVETRRRVAVERGPVVFCAEWPDVADGRALDLLVDRGAHLTASTDKGPLGDVVVIETDARCVSKPDRPSARARLVPYALWANRGVGEMNVWLSTAGYAIGDTGPAGGYIFYENPNHSRDGWRYLEAAPHDQSAGTTWGCFRRLIPGARGTAVGTGRQNTQDMLAACAEPGSAAHLCSALKINGIGGWFLPSTDELVLMYRNLKAAGLGNFLDGGLPDNVVYWASSQQTADMAAHVDFADLGRLHGDDKDFPRRVRAVRAI